MKMLEVGKVTNHEIIIEPSSNKGFVVRCGCGTFVAKNIDDLLVGLGEYLRDPDFYEKKYNELSELSVNQPIGYGPGEIAPSRSSGPNDCDQCQEEVQLRSGRR